MALKPKKPSKRARDNRKQEQRRQMQEQARTPARLEEVAFKRVG